MSPAARLERSLVAEALDREVLACVFEETVRAFRRQPSPLARNVLALRHTARRSPPAPIRAQTGAEAEITPFRGERTAL